MISTKTPRYRGVYRFFTLLGLAALLQVSCQAKIAGLVAIEIYPTSAGPGYLQISDFVLNGKNEVYLCPNDGSVDRSNYHKLAKVRLAAGMTLERDSRGVLMLTSGASPECVVPGNLKLDKGDASGAAVLADRAELDGTVLPGSDPATAQIMPLKSGVALYLVAEPNQEMSEYLRARRASTIEGWNAYLAKNSSAANAVAAQKALATLYVQAASADLQAWEAAKNGASAPYDKLREARRLVDEAIHASPDAAAAADVDHQVHAALLELTSESQEHLQSYRQALKDRRPGYANLVSAEALAHAAVDIEPSTAQAAQALRDTRTARSNFDNFLRDTNAWLASHNPDEAANTLAPLRPFAPENPRVSDAIKAISIAYQVHARELETASQWSGAVIEWQKAEAMLPSTAIEERLRNAQAQATAAADKATADAAMQKSQDFEAGGDILSAFEVLDDLAPAQRRLVNDRLEELKDKYIPAADAEAKSLQKAHEPITDISDEIGILKAYGDLQRCYRLTNDPALQDRMGVLGDDLSGYYLQQGKRFVAKPDGSGINVGWAYLTEALQYNSPTNAGPVRDLMTTAMSAHRLKSRLSIRVDFRDQTSRRDAPAFSNQLSDALATGLEASGLMVTVIRPGDATTVQPNFQLIGDVLRHDLGKSQSVTPRESMYRSGEHEAPNEAWNAANRDYERANSELENARSILQGVEARGKKKEIDSAKKTVADAEAKVEGLHERLDSIPRTTSEAIERPYTYSEVVYHVDPVVELQFRILDSVGDEIQPPIKVLRDVPRQYTVLQNVKAEDTKGVRAEGVIPDEQSFFEAAENQARDELIKEATQKIAQLPANILNAADRKAAQQDAEGAAELYILYLNSTREEDTPERQRIRKFLLQSFNFRTIPTNTPSA